MAVLETIGALMAGLWAAYVVYRLEYINRRMQDFTTRLRDVEREVGLRSD